MKQLRNEDKLLFEVKRIHFVGIGGSGMCPLAEILFHKGYTLTGSDNNESDPLKRIKSLGIKVYMGHATENINNAELVVYSAAISKDNPELVAAENKGIPTMERSHLLGALTRYFDNVIGVCGTHGKTTTTALLTQIFIMCGLDPTAVIGGRLPLINSNGRAGNTENMICESCEFVDTFLQMSPDISVLLNIDNDHLDYFKTMENLILSFHKFVSMSRVCFANGDDKLVKKAITDTNCEIITFGLNSKNDYCADNITQGRFGYKFTVLRKGIPITDIELLIPGKHNIYNCLAAFAVSDTAGISIDELKKAIESFGGASRRFEILGEYEKFVLADDYAHHPTEITATLSAAKGLNFKRITVVFQPFTFSRTKLLLKEFTEALSIADRVVLTPIMGSREVNTFGVSSEDIAVGLKDCVILDTFEKIADYIIDTSENGDLVITMGGGDIYKAAHIIQEKLK